MTCLRIFFAIFLLLPSFLKAEITLWHSYRGQEMQAMDQIIQHYNALQKEPKQKIKALNIPYEVLASKLSTAVPQGNGPDIFIFAHERIGDFVLAKIEQQSCFLTKTNLAQKVVPERPPKGPKHNYLLFLSHQGSIQMMRRYSDR